MKTGFELLQSDYRAHPLNDCKILYDMTLYNTRQHYTILLHVRGLESNRKKIDTINKDNREIC